MCIQPLLGGSARLGSCLEQEDWSNLDPVFRKYKRKSTYPVEVERRKHRAPPLDNTTYKQTGPLKYTWCFNPSLNKYRQIHSFVSSLRRSSACCWLHKINCSEKSNTSIFMLRRAMLLFILIFASCIWTLSGEATNPRVIVFSVRVYENVLEARFHFRPQMTIPWVGV